MQLFCRTDPNSCYPIGQIRTHKSAGIGKIHEQRPRATQSPSPHPWDIHSHKGFAPPAFFYKIPLQNSRFLSSRGKPNTFIFLLGHISIVLLLLFLPCPPKRAFHTSSHPSGFPSCLPCTHGAPSHSVNLFFPEGLFSLHESNGLILAIPLRKSSSLSRNHLTLALTFPALILEAVRVLKSFLPPPASQNIQWEHQQILGYRHGRGWD